MVELIIRKEENKKKENYEVYDHIQQQFYDLVSNVSQGIKDQTDDALGEYKKIVLAKSVNEILEATKAAMQSVLGDKMRYKERAMN